MTFRYIFNYNFYLNKKKKRDVSSTALEINVVCLMGLMSFMADTDEMQVDFLQ